VTLTRFLPLGVAKEVRALLPTWAAGMLVLVLARAFGDPKSYVTGLLVCGVAGVALGAQSMGHEYTHRTLVVQLTQPSPRARLLGTKLLALVPLLLTLAAVAWLLLLNPLHDQFPMSGRRGTDWSSPAVILLPVLVGLSLAPLLTIVCRSSLAGIVFSITIPAVLGLSVQLLALAAYGSAHVDSDAAARFATIVFWSEMGATSAGAALGTWLMFRRLEAIEGPSADIQLAATWRPASIYAPAHRHPVWLLVKKEIHLQQMAFVVAGLYLAGWATLSLARHFVPEIFGPPLGAVALLYVWTQALLIGSLSSAEERQLGTLPSQMLLPVAAWRQWLVKIGTSLVLALALGLGWAALLATLHPSPEDIRVHALYFGLVILLTSSSLYVSTLCNSGVKALLLSLSAVPVLAVWLRWLDAGLTFALQALGVAQFPPSAKAISLSGWLAPGMAAGYVVLTLWFGMSNHRSMERAAVRAWPQAVWIASYFVACLGVEWLVLTYY
jgi:ABC-type transport system involved in multi-copper enzyme maturation permease subunit